MNKYKSIVDKLYSKDPNEVNIIMHSRSYNPNDILKIEDSVVIISKDIYDALVKLYNDCKNNRKEYGCFIFGNKLSKNIIFYDTLPETYFKSNKDSIDVVDENIKELLMYIESEKYNSIAHIHTHPSLEGANSENYSDQDLYVYAYLQKNFQNRLGNINYMGGLLTATLTMKDLSFIFYDELKEVFYGIEKVYIFDNKENNLSMLNIDNKDIKRLCYEI